MIKVTLLGDSIRELGYGSEVPKLLGDEYEVYQPVENCRFAKFTLNSIQFWQDDMEGSKIVHWNNGLWDCADTFGDGVFTSKEEYVATMVRTAKLLLKRYGKVIFATITPVLKEHPHIKIETIREYNAAVVPELEKLGVVINDLHSLVASDMDKYLRKDDFIHLTEEGIKVCAEQVANAIKEVAKTL